METQPLPESYFEGISEEPLKLLPFDPESKRRALEYGKTLVGLLAPMGASAELHGSTDLELAGKGEWEFAVWLDDSSWYTVIAWLVNHYRSIFVLDDEFALFEDRHEGTPIEVICMRGSVAQRNQAIMKYWRGSAAARAEYEQGKLAHAYSKRAYARWKDRHITEILERL